jgi:chromate transporter
MHRILIEEKNGFLKRDFLCLITCMLLPGPEAQQLVTYIGWLLHGVWGGILAGSIFILPGALSMMLFCILYVSYGHHYLFATLSGMRCAVIAILFQSIFRLSLRALTDNSQMINGKHLLFYCDRILPRIFP